MKEKDKTLEVVVILLIFLGAVWLLISNLWEKSLAETFIPSMITGLVIYLLFFAKYFWIVQKPNYALILQNMLVGKEERNNENIIDELYIPKGQRACFGRLVAKLPWEEIVDEPISLDKTVPIEDIVRVADKRNELFEISYQVELTALRNQHLCRYPLIPNDVAVTYFKAFFKSAIEQTFRNAPNGGAELMGNLDGFRGEFRNLQGGSDRVSPDEKRYGRFTGSPYISQIRRGDTAEQSAQVVRLAEDNAEAIQALIEKGVSPAVAAALIAGLQEVDIGVTPLIFEGLPAGMTHMGDIGVGPKLNRTQRKGKSKGEKTK